MRPWPLVVLLAIALVAVPALGQDTETEIASTEDGASAKLVGAGLSMPVDIAFGPDGTLYYAAFETGELRAVREGGEEVLWTAPNLQLGGERGFVGLAVAPDFATSKAFYVFYQTNKSGDVVSRFSKVVEGVETVLIDDIMSGLLHNSGRITFDHEGLILLSVGDGVLDTVGRKASQHAHDPTVLNGKILRLTADGAPAPGNPWGNEVWTKGHRNVYGLAASPDGVVIGTENGPESWDEINVLEAGKDYGWPTCSGACGEPGFVDPVLAYESTIAPTGAVWYEGAFYFTDFNKGSVHRIYERADGTWADERVLKFTTPRILDIAVGPEGLYLSTWDSVWQLTPGPVPDAASPPRQDEEPPTPPSATPPPSAPPTGPSAGPSAELPDEGRIPAPGAAGLVLALVAAVALARLRRR